MGGVAKQLKTYPLIDLKLVLVFLETCAMAIRSVTDKNSL